MREAGHDGVGMLLGKVEQSALRRLDQIGDLIDCRAQVQPHVGRDLVVARARGVQPLAGVADQRGEPLLDVAVHVLEIVRPLEAAGADLSADLREPRLDRRQVLGAQDFDRVQHARVRNRAFDVELGQPPVKID